MSRLWYTAPASVWEEALPLGNGRLGGMVYGGILNEKIQLNEESVWYGGCIFIVDDDGTVLLRNEKVLRCAVRNGVVYCDGVFLTSDALR